MTGVLLIDDDPYGARAYVDALKDGGFQVEYVRSVERALELARSESFDVIVLDVMMPSGSAFDEIETEGGFATGVALARELAEIQPTVKIIALTASTDPSVEAWFTKDDTVAYLQKQRISPEDLPSAVRRSMHQNVDPPKVFIVHGHDNTSLLELKNFLQNRFGWPEPTILAEQPSRGLTLIEKFEAHAAAADLVFVLLTEDDVGGLRDGEELNGRARQNVVFEYGYFLGVLQRKSGRVFLLVKGNPELPSDLSGIVYVDITNGVEAAGETLRRELAEWT